MGEPNYTYQCGYSRELKEHNVVQKREGKCLYINNGLTTHTFD